MNVRHLLSQACSELLLSTEGRREAEILLCHTLGVSRSWIYANPEKPVNAAHCAAYMQLIQKRREGQPIAYITGSREFWSLPLKVTPAVLVPRPETELLVEKALECIPVNKHWRVADLGTGSGAIALAIASERPSCEIHATEISREALSIAQENAKNLGLEQIQFHHGSWLTPLTGRFACIVSNPPYVSISDPHMQRGDCRFEPESALSPGSDALASIRQIAETALPHLEKGGTLAFEHGFEQGPGSRKILLELGYVNVKTVSDLAGLERVTLGSKS